MLHEESTVNIMSMLPITIVYMVHGKFVAQQKDYICKDKQYMIILWTKLPFVQRERAYPLLLD